MTEREVRLAPGDEIRRLRVERGLSPVDVQHISDLVHRRKNCADFSITHATLSEIENEQSVPNVRKMFSLAACFQIPLESILALYGVDPDDVKGYYEHSHSVETQIGMLDSCFVLPFDSAFDMRRTGPIHNDVMQWSRLPDILRTRLDPARYKYAWVGTQDEGMGELIPAGSLIEIDRNQIKVETAGWTSLRDRPIFFFWTIDGYRCAWCELAEDQLVLIPHPQSSETQVKLYRTPREATIIGRVTFAWVPFGRAGNR